jgi:hypothetical protein
MNTLHSNKKINKNPGDRNTTLIRLVGASFGLLIFLPQNSGAGQIFQENLTYTGAAIVATLLILLGLQWSKINQESGEEFPTSKS